MLWFDCSRKNIYHYQSKVVSWVSHKVSISLLYEHLAISIIKVISLANHCSCLHPPLPLFPPHLYPFLNLDHYLKRPLLESSPERWGLTFKWCCHSWANFLETLEPKTEVIFLRLSRVDNNHKNVQKNKLKNCSNTHFQNCIYYLHCWHLFPPIYK